MTPLKLELSGFTVFRDSTSVELEGLELFAISGPTGSGKSTLLDALTYALYGQTARLGRTGLDVLISPDASQMSVALAFKTARGTYRVTRSADRKPSGSVTRETRIEVLEGDANWRQLSESEKLKEADAKLEQIVGLDYDGFTRSVLLPQGAFDELLKGDTGKRRKLLVNLLGLDRVEAMQKEAGRRARDAEAQQQNLIARLEQDYAGATPERRRELKSELESLTKQRTEMGKRQETLQKDLKELDEVKTLLDEQAKLQSTLETLTKQADEMTAARKTVALAEKARLLVPQLTQVEAAEKKLQQTEKRLAEGEKAFEAKQTEVKRTQVDLKQAQTKAETRLPELETQLTSLAEVVPLVAQLSSRGGNLELASQAKPGVTYSEEAWDEWQTLRSHLPALQQAEASLKENRKELETATTSLETLREKEKTTATDLKTLESKGKEARTVSEKADKAFEKAVTADQAAVLQAHLHVGEPCPVCAQTVTELPPATDSRAAELKEARDAAKKALDELRERYQEVKGELATVKARAEDAGKRAEDLQKKQEQLTGTLEKQQKAFEPLNVERSEVKGALEARRTVLLAALAAQIHAQTGGADPTKVRQDLQQEKRGLETTLKNAETAYQTARGVLERLETQREMLEGQLGDLRDEAEGARAALQKVLVQADFADADAVRAAVLRDDEISAYTAKLKVYDMQKESTERRDVEVQAKLAGRTLNEAHYADLKREEAELKATLAEVQTNLGRTEGALQHVEEQLEKAKDLRKQLTEQQALFERYRLLSLDLRGNEFQEYLLAQVQAKLAARASHIIRDVTEGRYDLRLEEGDYVVRDAWSPGEARNAKTLSGGETFIASLALALALSDTVAGSHALGALFLDEGFGTLDSDTLSSVAGVLENLTREGRMVGVITHVKDLTQRLPACLTVTKGVGGSSLSWDL